MSVFLVGGGWTPDHTAAAFGGFADAVRARAAGQAQPRVGLVVIGTDEEDRTYHEKFLSALREVGLDGVVVTRVAEGDACPAEALDELDGLFVGGGRTPAYHAALAPHGDRIRELVRSGVPYAGFSAGAAVAATHAIVGGWRIGGVPVCPEESNEDLDEVSVLPGLGLVEGSVDVHAAQWGNLSRLTAVVDAGLAPFGIGIDECTTIESATGRITGQGAVWQVTRGPDGATVTRTPAPR